MIAKIEYIGGILRFFGSRLAHRFDPARWLRLRLTYTADVLMLCYALRRMFYTVAGDSKFDFVERSNIDLFDCVDIGNDEFLPDKNQVGVNDAGAGFFNRLFCVVVFKNGRPEGGVAIVFFR